MSPIRVGTNLRITASASQGGRRYMEDRVHIEVFRKADDSIDWVYCAVYDGHGGPEASEFVRRNLLTNIRNSPNFNTDDDDEFLEVIRQGFVQTHYSMLKVVDTWPKTSSGYSCTAGTTASCVFVRNGKLYTGHVGDSAIFLGRLHEGEDFGARLEAIRLTVDHKPDSPEERHRIESAGGAVMNKAGINRVVWNRPKRGHSGPVTVDTPVENIPFLAVARALGDLWSYSHLTGEYVVSPDPDVAVIRLDQSVKCLVLGSDGLTNVMNAQQMMDTVNTHEWKDLLKTYGTRAYDRVLDRPVHNNHAQWLLRQAMRQWGSLRADNISVIVMIFDDDGVSIVDDHSSVAHSGLDLCLDDELTVQPDTMVRCDNKTVQRLRTTPVDLAYYGLVDKNFKITDYKGPGFVIHRTVREGSEERNGLARPRSLRNVMSSASSSHSEPSSRTSNNNPVPLPGNRLPSILAALHRSKEAEKEKLDQEQAVPADTNALGDKTEANAVASQPLDTEFNPADVSIVEDALLPTEEVEPSPSDTEPAHPEPTSTADAEGDPIERPKSRMDRRPDDEDGFAPLNDAECEETIKEKVEVNEEDKEADVAKENGDARKEPEKKEKLKFFCKKHGGNCEKAQKLNQQHKLDRENKKKLETKSTNGVDVENQVECTVDEERAFEAGDSRTERRSLRESSFMQSLPLFPRLGASSALSPSAMLSAMRAVSASSSNLPASTVTPFRSLSLDSPMVTSPPIIQGTEASDETPVNRNGIGRRLTNLTIPFPDIEATTDTVPSPKLAPQSQKRPRVHSNVESDAHIEPRHKRFRVLDFFHSVTGLLGVGGGGDKRDKSGANK